MLGNRICESFFDVFKTITYMRMYNKITSWIRDKYFLISGGKVYTGEYKCRYSTENNFSLLQWLLGLCCFFLVKPSLLPREFLFLSLLRPSLVSPMIKQHQRLASFSQGNQLKTFLLSSKRGLLGRTVEWAPFSLPQQSPLTMFPPLSLPHRKEQQEGQLKVVHWPLYEDRFGSHLGFLMRVFYRYRKRENEEMDPWIWAKKSNYVDIKSY